MEEEQKAALSLFDEAKATILAKQENIKMRVREDNA